MQDISQGIAKRVSECLLFNTNAAMLQNAFLPSHILCKDLEKPEFVAFSQICSRNQEVIKGV
jgi:hypothetical protein